MIGTTTFGTGTVLTPYTLSDGSVLLLGTSQWLTADGRKIRGQGIEPDITVELPEDGIILFPREVARMDKNELVSSKDTQLLRAIQLLGEEDYVSAPLLPEVINRPF